MITEKDIDEDEIRVEIMEEEVENDKLDDDEDIEKEAKAISEQKRVVRYLEQLSGIQDSSEEDENGEPEVQMFKLAQEY